MSEKSLFFTLTEKFKIYLPAIKISLITRAALAVLGFGQLKRPHILSHMSTIIFHYFTKKEQGMYFYILYSLHHPYLNDIGFLGSYAENFLKNINADSVFFSCKGLSDDGLITDVSELEISMRKTMLKQSRNSFYLCDFSKLGAKFSFTLCGADDITEIICDEKLPDFSENA